MQKVVNVVWSKILSRYLKIYFWNKKNYVKLKGKF